MGPTSLSAYTPVANLSLLEVGWGRGVKADFPSRRTSRYLAKIVTAESDSDIVHAHRRSSMLTFWLWSQALPD